MDTEELFCANCGTENPYSDYESAKLQSAASHHSFGCQACGASMSYDASAQAHRCPFCGSTRMQRQESVRTIKPEGIIPNAIEQARAESVLRQWLGRGFWRPSDAAKGARIGKITLVYVPYWVFRAETDTLWNADVSPAPAGSRGDWHPVTGSNSSRYEGVLVGGSSVLSASEIAGIAPYDLQAVVELSAVELENEIVEEFRVPRKLARPSARAIIESLERDRCSRRLSGRSRNLRLNMQISAMQGSPLLLPVWILAYTYRKEVHRVLINGQTAKIAGSAPFSYGKLFVILGVIVAVIILFGLLSALASSI